jgi:hypothetical protein
MNIGGRLVRLMAASSLILFGACKSPTDSTIVNIEITDTTNVNNGGGNGGGVVGGNGQCSSGQNPTVTFTPNIASGNPGATQPVTVNISCGPTSGNFSTTNTNGSVSSSGLVTFVSSGTFQVCYTLASGFKACSGTWTTNASDAGNQPTVTAVTIGNPHVTYSTCNAWPGQPFNYTVSTTGGASTAVTFELLTHHAVQAINSSTGMMTLFSPAVAGTDTIKIASAFDPTKFALAEFTVTLCGGNNGGNTITVPSDTVELSLCTNGASGTTTYQMELFVNGVQAAHSDLIFMVDSNGISVSPSGLVTPVALGWHRVRVALRSDPNNFATVWFHVTNTACQAPPSTVTPTGPITIGSGPGCTNNTVQFTASTSGSWASSNTSIATVSSSGLVTAIPNANGSTTITFTPSNGGSPITRTVNVTNASCQSNNGGVVSVTVNPPSATLPIGGQMTFTAIVQTTGSTPGTVNWANSGDGCYSIVNTNGNNVTVQAMRACANSTLTAVSTADPSKSGMATITVTSGVNSIDYTPPGGTIRKDSTVTITAHCETQAGYACNPYYTSNHPELITVNGNGSPVTIGSVTYPAGTTATLKAVGNNPSVDVEICVQAAVQDSTMRTCHIWHTAP